MFACSLVVSENFLALTIPFDYSKIRSTWVPGIDFEQSSSFVPNLRSNWTFIEQVIDSFITFSHKLHLKGLAKPCLWMLSQVSILLLRTSQQKAAILGHQFPHHIFFHLDSFSCLYVSFITPIASLMLNLPRLEYPRLILSYPSCHGILLKQRSV